MKRKAIIVDIDGTVADLKHRLPFIQKDKPDWRLFFATCVDDKPIMPVCDLVKLLLHDINHDIVFVSGRSNEVEEQTRDWLSNIFSPPWSLFMRQAGDHRPDNIVKKELYEKHIADKWDVWFVLDDRDQVVKMWRDMGLTCLQVAAGDF